MSKIITLDVETTIHTSFKRKANPFDPRNWVVYRGHKPLQQDSTVKRFTSKENSSGWLADVIQHDTRFIVAFNGKFDILHAIASDERNYRAWKSFVAGGGVVWDVQLAEYLLRGMTPDSHMLSLDEVAPVYGGELKDSEVKALWEAGVQTDVIPEDLIIPYLHGDCVNTEKCFLGQLAKAQKVGQLRSLMVNFGSLSYTIEAEKNGMAINMELGREYAKELEAEIKELDARLVGYLPDDLPYEFNWGSRTQLSALIFGGTIKYEARDYIRDDAGNLTYPQMDEDHFARDDGTTISQEVWRSWADAFAKGLLVNGAPIPAPPSLATNKGGKNAGIPKTKKVKVPDNARPKMKNFERYYKFKGFTGGSKKWETSNPGVYSVSNEVIAALANRDIPFLKDLGRRSSAVKDLGTYFIYTNKDGVEAGMLTLVQPDGIIHHSLNHTSTVTARFSSSNPNLQNLPKGNKSKVKKIFVSRWGGEGRVIQSDFKSLEIYIQAILTKCKNLIADLKAGLDMHCVRVSQKFGITYEEALRLCVTEGIPEWKYRRTGAKEFSFQRAYGAGVAAICESTGMSKDEVEGFIAAELERYPDLEGYYDVITAEIKRSRGPQFGRYRYVQHPDFPARTVELGVGYIRTPDGKLYSYMEHCSPKFMVERENVWASFSPPEIKNYVVQGTGAEWAKAAMWIAVRAFYERDNFGGLALLTNQVHDATYADAHVSVAPKAAALLHACMEAASPFMEHYFSMDVPVYVPSDTGMGLSMADEEKIEGLKEMAAAYTQEIQHLIKIAA